MRNLPRTNQGIGSAGTDVIKCIFMDPPDNIGLGYQGYNDSISPDHYYNWLELLLTLSLRKAQIVWLSYYWQHDCEIKYRLRDLLKHVHPLTELRQFLWRFTFSQYNDKDCTVGFRYMLRLKSYSAQIYVDEKYVDPSGVEGNFVVREESARMLYGDSRAAGPRVPDTVWDYPRVVGNAKERRSWHPTQHPQALMERIVSMCCNKDSNGRDEVFVDLFEGSGTSLRACQHLNRKHLGVEQSVEYLAHIQSETGVSFIPYNVWLARDC